jgi:hypothetical protein
MVKPIEEVKPGLKSVIKLFEYKKEISKEQIEEISNPEQKIKVVSIKNTSYC